MKYRYGKYTGDDLEGLNLEDLVSKLSDLLLSSGFRSPYGPFDGTDHTLQSLHDAILEALLNGGLLPEDTLERLLGDPADGDAKEGRNELEELIQRIIDQLYQQGFVAPQPDLSAEQARRAAGRGRSPDRTTSRRSASRSPTRASTFSATARFAICLDRSAAAASAGTTRAIWPPASK